jgi:hypothetical protein
MANFKYRKQPKKVKLKAEGINPETGKKMTTRRTRRR